MSGLRPKGPARNRCPRGNPARARGGSALRSV